MESLDLAMCRPGAIRTGRPSWVSAVRWRAAGTETLLTPGITSYVKGTVPRSLTSSSASIVLS
ncbi:hypothetical protein ACIPXV_12180 [Streptomyces libani]|uniref:hypothetical protein n=1 Tax=Streptomyces nigrescens TaxID=1920 RepID=UPI0038277647